MTVDDMMRVSAFQAVFDSFGHDNKMNNFQKIAKAIAATSDDVPINKELALKWENEYSHSNRGGRPRSRIKPWNDDKYQPKTRLVDIIDIDMLLWRYGLSKGNRKATIKSLSIF